MIIDTHCHYNLSPLLENWHDHWKTAQAHGVVASMVVGTDLDSCQSAVDIATENPALFPAIGIHPHVASGLTLESIGDATKRLGALLSNKKVIAIGECGLDYFRFSAGEDVDSTKALQKELLRQQLQLADQSRLPLLIHLRDTKEDAYWDFLNIYKDSVSNGVPFVLHCVSGPLEFIKQCVELGAYIGVAGNVTYNNSDHIRSIVATTPKHKILVETDAPFLPPLPHRGKICEPWMIQLTEEYLREFASLEDSQLIENTTTLFPQFKDML